MNPTNPVWASFPVLPPIPNLPFGELRENGNVYLTSVGIDYNQILWASIQGIGGILDIILMDLPSAGITNAATESLLDQIGTTLSFLSPQTNVAFIQQLIDEAVLFAARPALVAHALTPVLNELPTGAIDGANVTFTLAINPSVAGISLFLNGVLQQPGVAKDYTLSVATITMTVAPSIGDILLANYFT